MKLQMEKLFKFGYFLKTNLLKTSFGNNLSKIFLKKSVKKRVSIFGCSLLLTANKGIPAPSPEIRGGEDFQENILLVQQCPEGNHFQVKKGRNYRSGGTASPFCFFRRGNRI